MSVWDLRQNNIKNITLVSITLTIMTLDSCVWFAAGNYVLKPYKWNKENVIIMFGSYIRIMLGIWVRLALGSYVIKLCKWD